uniref:Membrane anchored junction protein n=1 Tax=Amphiprion ocellaris TaxID=80972 RepID=A0A3Q1BN79_AMPOC
MSLQPFSFPFPETRYFKAGSFIYKFEITGGSSYSGEEVIRGEYFNQELEEIIRTILGNLDSLQPFSTNNYIVFPYERQWESVCKHTDNLTVYPFVLILYLEKNMKNAKQAEQQNEAAQHEPDTYEPPPKRRRTDSPLEEAIIKDLIVDMEAEGRVSIRGKVKSLHTQGEARDRPERVDKKETRAADRLLLNSGVSLSRSPGGTTQGDTEEEEEEEEE